MGTKKIRYPAENVNNLIYSFLGFRLDIFLILLIFFNKFKEIFINDIINLLFLKYEEWNHEIILKPEIKFIFGVIYLLSVKELKILRKYLNENLKKKY